MELCSSTILASLYNLNNGLVSYNSPEFFPSWFGLGPTSWKETVLNVVEKPDLLHFKETAVTTHLTFQGLSLLALLAVI